MASREPMWYCHQCNAEMRPLMVPEPVCASCRGSFVEKIEDPEDDPREFHRGDIGDEFPLGADPVMMLLQGLINRGPPSERSRPRSPRSPRTSLDSPPSSGSGITFQFHSSGGGGGTRTFTVGGPRTLGGQPGGIPTMSDGPDRDNGITGALMAQYLMAMLGHRGPIGDMFGGMDPTERGRMGDYVFNQEALDQIISQLMEQSNASRPVPATEEIISNLPREVLEAGSPMLQKDCAVCKEQFTLETEDPDEQVVVTLPCKHPFHEPCILPWLKSSGTCPVCRHQLVPQPSHSSPPPSGSSGSPPNSSSRPRSPGRDGHSGHGGGGGFLQSLFGLGGSGSSGSSSNPSSTSRHTRSPSDPEARRSSFSNLRRNSAPNVNDPNSRPSSSRPRNEHNHNHFPGSWDDLD
ncbi:zinc finger protein 364 [Moniliophthora roreri MCA 2997]|uniref:Zinc finger protein 364 n=1 Tax=Moniliophthora roreri (strain MCA 2997) TaxID=1381753 RepID=V2X0R3_MONRO|nr:zinc finger protein 364 [Moniliophthora roreri MCA 2997]